MVVSGLGVAIDRIVVNFFLDKFVGNYLFYGFCLVILCNVLFV